MIRIAASSASPGPGESHMPAVEHDLAFIIHDRAGKNLHERAFARPVLSAEREPPGPSPLEKTRPGALARPPKLLEMWRISSRAGSETASEGVGSWPIGWFIPKRRLRSESAAQLR